jgi:signal peptidase II
MKFWFERKYLLLLSLTGFIVSIDQLTKIYVHTQFQLHESIPVVPGYFHITYVRNFGAAFGFMSQMPEIIRESFFFLVAPIACLIILAILRGVNNDNTKQIVALSSIFAGAIGNYIDRLQFKYVIDFLDFYWGSLSWPAFNIADSAIVLGVLSLIYLMYVENKSTAEVPTDTKAA